MPDCCARASLTAARGSSTRRRCGACPFSCSPARPRATTLDLRLLDPSGRDPGLVVDVRDERRALLFDLGARAPAPRKLLECRMCSSPTPTWTTSPASTTCSARCSAACAAGAVGGPGFVDQVEHKLRAYTWNVVHRYEVPMVIEAFASASTARGRTRASTARSASSAAKVLRAPSARGRRAARRGAVSRARRVVDHEMPVPGVRASRRRRSVRVARERIAAHGRSRPAPGCATEARGSGRQRPTTRRSTDALARSAGEHADGARSVSCVPSARRCRAAYRLRDRPALHRSQRRSGSRRCWRGVDPLFIECVFLDADRDTRGARTTYGAPGRLIARTVGAPGHACRSTSRRATAAREAALRAEVQAAWEGRQTAAARAASAIGPGELRRAPPGRRDQSLHLPARRRSTARRAGTSVRAPAAPPGSARRASRPAWGRGGSFVAKPQRRSPRAAPRRCRTEGWRQRQVHFVDQPGWHILPDEFVTPRD